MSNKKPKGRDFVKVNRPPEELEQLFIDHLDVLANHCLQYDLGKRHFAAEIALNLRVLLSDTPGTENRSLLHQIGREEQAFLNTERTMAQDDPNIFISQSGGLVFSQMRLEGHELIQDWSPNLYIHQYPPLFSTPYASWWQADLLHTTNNEKFSRRRLVRQMANQDRGGHVAPGIEKAYFEFTRGDVIGKYECIIEGDAVTNPSLPIDPTRVLEVSRKGSGQRMARALLRQIAHEVLFTLCPDREGYLSQLIMPPQGVFPAMFLQCEHSSSQDGQQLII